MFILQSVLLKILIKNPFLGRVAAEIRFESNQDIKRLKLLTLNQIILQYNPVLLGEWTENQLYGAVIHELYHLLFLHPIRKGRRDSVMWSFACDLAVNSLIPLDYLPPASLTVAIARAELGIVLKEKQAAEYYYDKLSDMENSFDFTFRQGESFLSFPSEQEYFLEELDDSEISEMNRNAAVSRMAQLCETAAAQDDVPEVLRRTLGTIYSSLDGDWRNVLKKYFSGKGVMRTRKTPKKISRRFDDLPGSRRHKGLEAFVALDESGSISDSFLMSFQNELRKISRLFRCDIKVSRFDSECSEPLSLKSFLHDTAREKQGGTDFRPVFEIADRCNARFVIIFSDGDGYYPQKKVQQKVLWVLTDPECKPSFGDVVYFRENV